MTVDRRASTGALGAVASFALAQGSLMGASFLRLPFVIDALGADGFGAYVLVGSLAPFLMVATSGSRVAARTLVAEADEGCRASRAAASWRVAVRVAAIHLIVGVPLAIGVGLVLGQGLVGSGGALAGVLVVCVVGCSLSIPGGMAWGLLEADGRQALVHTLVTATAWIGLVVTVVVAVLGGGFVALSVVNLASTVGPFVVAVAWIGREVIRSRPAPFELGAARRVARASTSRAVAPLGARALDPFVIAPVLGAAAAGTAGLAQRTSLASTVVIQATAPIIARDIGRRRAEDRAVTTALVLRSASVQATIAATLGAVLVMIGPWLCSVLSGGAIVVPRPLFVAFAVAAAGFAATETVAACASTPSGQRFAWRVEGLAMVVNVVLSVVLVRRLGLAGPVWASAVASFGALAGWVVALRAWPALLTERHLAGLLAGAGRQAVAAEEQKR